MNSRNFKPEYRAGDYVHGSAAPAEKFYEHQPEEYYEESEVRARPSTSNVRTAKPPIITISGAVIVGVLFLLLLVEHSNYANVAREVSGLNAELRALQEQERRLEIQLESVVDMHEIERFARDVLGMSNPEGGASIVRGTMQDRVVIIQYEGSGGGLLSRFTAFISSTFNSLR